MFLLLYNVAEQFVVANNTPAREEPLASPPEGDVDRNQTESFV